MQIDLHICWWRRSHSQVSMATVHCFSDDSAGWILIVWICLCFTSDLGTLRKFGFSVRVRGRWWASTRISTSTIRLVLFHNSFASPFQFLAWDSYPSLCFGNRIAHLTVHMLDWHASSRTPTAFYVWVINAIVRNEFVRQLRLTTSSPGLNVLNDSCLTRLPSTTQLCSDSCLTLLSCINVCAIRSPPVRVQAATLHLTGARPC